jgi:two-component system, chemotaxis family, chemotaxis protein CheY
MSSALGEEGTRGEVLLVDDDRDIRETVAELLREEGYSVHIVSSGAAAVEHLKQHAPPRLILLDLMMPEMNGWEFLAVQKSQVEWAEIPVLLFSAHASVARVPLPRSVVGVIPKPVELDALLENVERACSKRLV